MISRRDIVYGFVLFVFLSFIGLGALLILVSLTSDSIHISKKSIAVVEITGVIFSPDTAVEKIERYITEENIPAIVLRLNTPGGGISATQEIYETVRKARAAGKKVIASMGTVAASGGYYIAAACDTIIATPGTITGSIGVIATFPEFSELYRKIGVNFTVVKAGKFKDTGSSSRKMTDEEKAELEALILDSYEQFLDAVAESRGLTLDEVRQIAEGRVYTGRQALEKGLVDLLGTYQDAVDLAGELAGIGKNPPVIKEKRGTIWEALVNGINTLFFAGIERSFPRIMFMMQY